MFTWKRSHHISILSQRSPAKKRGKGYMATIPFQIYGIDLFQKLELSYQAYRSSAEILEGITQTYKFRQFFLCLVFLSPTRECFRTAGEGRGYFINSSLPLLPASQTLRHQSGDYCRELTSAHMQQPESNREPLLSERKSLTTKLRALAMFEFSLVSSPRF